MITNVQVDAIRKTYYSNKEDLENIRTNVRNGWCDICVPECFEQGYNNAIEYVCHVLDIKL